MTKPNEFSEAPDYARAADVVIEAGREDDVETVQQHLEGEGMIVYVQRMGEAGVTLVSGGKRFPEPGALPKLFESMRTRVY